MQFTERGATLLWQLIQKQATNLGNFAILFLENTSASITEDTKGVTYWKGVAAFLREWADTLDDHASTIEQGSRKQKSIDSQT